MGGQSEDISAPELYDLKNDIAEKMDISAQYPEVVERLMKKVEQARADIGDYNRKGENCRTDVHWLGARRQWLAQGDAQAVTIEDN